MDTQHTPSQPAESAAGPALPDWAFEMLRCPAEGGQLEPWTSPDGRCWLRSINGQRCYPINGNVPVLLPSAAVLLDELQPNEPTG